MASDASIYGLIRPVQPPQLDGPADQYTKLLTIRDLLRRGELGALQLQQAKQGIADDDVYRAAAMESGGDYGKLRDLLLQKGNPKAALSVGEAARKASLDEANIAKTKAETGKATAETHLKQMQGMRDALASVRDQASYDAWKEAMLRTYGPDVAARSNAPAQYDPAWQQQSLMTADKVIEQANKNREFGLAQRGQDITMRGQNLSADTQRRGQDLTATTARQGQNITMRGQDLTAEANKAKIGAVLQAKGMGTDTERMAAGYYNRMLASEEIMSGPSLSKSQSPGMGELAAQNMPFVGGETQANFVRSAGRQRAKAAQDDWIRAKLRKESGAVIGADEMEQERRTYFPQPGDAPPVVAQKAQARRRAIEAMKLNAGRAASNNGGAGDPSSLSDEALMQMLYGN